MACVITKTPAPRARPFTRAVSRDRAPSGSRCAVGSSKTDDTVVSLDEKQHATRRLQQHNGEEDPPFKGAPAAKVAPAEITGDRKTVENVLTNFQMAKARLIQRMEADYGGTEYFDTLFMDHQPAMEMPNGADKCSIGRNAFLHGSDTSAKAWARTVRKMKINLLEYLMSGNVQDFVWATA